MEEIKVGEYVRTKDGRIYRVADENEEWIRSDIFYKVITKHSSIPIDLIEKGDYVNGERVLVVDDIITDGGEKAILVENYDEWTDDGVITNKDIKSIVTHEQFAQIEYKVEE